MDSIQRCQYPFEQVPGLGNRIEIYMYHRHKLRIMEEKHREMAERERISRELSLAAKIQAEALPDSALD